MSLWDLRAADPPAWADLSALIGRGAFLPSPPSVPRAQVSGHGSCNFDL